MKPLTLLVKWRTENTACVCVLWYRMFLDGFIDKVWSGLVCQQTTNKITKKVHKKFLEVANSPASDLTTIRGGLVGGFVPPALLLRKLGEISLIPDQ